MEAKQGDRTHSCPTNGKVKKLIIFAKQVTTGPTRTGPNLRTGQIMHISFTQNSMKSDLTYMVEDAVICRAW